MRGEIRQIEIRADGHAIAGTAINYGERAEIMPGRFERFEPGSLSWDDVILNRQHRRDLPLARTGAGLSIMVDANAVKFRAELPNTVEATDLRTLVASGIMRGASIEFVAERERQEGDVRVIEAARLLAIAVVDQGAYAGSTVEARARWGGTWFRGVVPFNKKLGCDCHRGRCGDVEFGEASFDEILKSDREVLVVTGNFDRAVASRLRGTMRLSKSDEGMVVELDRTAGATPAGKELAAMMTAVPVSARPIFNQELSEFVEGEGADTARYGKVHLRAILLKPTVDSRGWPEGTILAADAPRRRMKAWA